MPRNSDDLGDKIEQSTDRSATDNSHTVFFTRGTAERLSELASNNQVNPHVIGGSAFSERKGSTVVFLISDLRSSQGENNMEESVGMLNVNLNSRISLEDSAPSPDHLPQLKITSIDPLEGHLLKNKDDKTVLEPISRFLQTIPFDGHDTKAVDQSQPQTTDEGSAGQRPADIQDTQSGSSEETRATGLQTDPTTDDRSSDEPPRDRAETERSISLNIDEEARALSTMFDNISRTDFWVLDNGNIGVELSMVPTSDAVDRFDILLEYDNSFPDYPPRVWVQKPDLSSDDEAVVEVDHYGDARVQYMEPHVWAQQKSTKLALEHLAGWATAYCKQQESTTGEEMIRQTRRYAEEAGRQIIDGFAGRTQNDPDADETDNTSSDDNRLDQRDHNNNKEPTEREDDRNDESRRR